METTKTPKRTFGDQFRVIELGNDSIEVFIYVFIPRELSWEESERLIRNLCFIVNILLA